MVTIETRRLILRDLTPADASNYCDLYTDCVTMQHIGPPMTIERAHSRFEAALRRSSLRKQSLLAIQRQGSNEFLGICAIQNLNLSKRRAEIGIILNRRGRGRHVSREAFRATIAHAFDTFTINELRALIAHDNVSAQRLCLDTGFRPCHDSSARRVLSLAREDWKQT